MLPWYIHRFRFLQPHFLLESEKFNITYPDPSQLMDISDKLRYYRYKAGLLQREVADHVGIERTTYSSYEEVGRDYYPIDVLARIAELFEIDIADLMDGYHAFLHRGQATQVRALRRHMGLTQKAFAIRFNVSVVQVKRWEQGKVRVARKKWHIMFEVEMEK